MYVVKTIIGFLPYSLAVLPFLIFVALMAAFAGHKFGSGGAIGVSTILCLLYSWIWSSLPPAAVVDSKYYFSLLFVIVVSLSFVLIPMLAARRAQWKRGRLVLGLSGATASALLVPTFALSVACGVLGDCL